MSKKSSKLSDLSKETEMATFRLGCIAPVISNTHSMPSAAAYFKSLLPLTAPNGEKITSHKTLEKWLADFNRDGYDGLKPRGRSDRGSVRKLNQEACEEIAVQLRAHPLMKGTQIYMHLRENGYISKDVSVDTVQRFIRSHKNELVTAENPQMRDRKAFEAEQFGQIWQADTCYICKINDNGVPKQVYSVAIIDDHTRLIVGAELFFSDNAYNFQCVLKQAISAYGIPAVLYTDNGSPYKNWQLSEICGRLGVSLVHTAVRDGASKGKAERMWRTLKETWLYNFNPSDINSLDELRRMYRSFVRSYNRSEHRMIGTSPICRFHNARSCTRKIHSPEWLNECFLNRQIRRVYKDATISIDGERYDVPMQFIAEKEVEVRYIPGDMSTAFVTDSSGKRYPIKPTDVHANAKTKRNNTPSLDYGKMRTD